MHLQQSANSVDKKLNELNIERTTVPKNMTHLWQFLHLTTNGAMEHMENPVFSEDFTNGIATELSKDFGDH